MLCFSCPPPFHPPVPICIVTAESHPSERLVGGSSGEKILLWEPVAERSYRSVVVVTGQKVSIHCWSVRSKAAPEPGLGSSQTFRTKSLKAKLPLCLVAGVEMLHAVISGLSISGNYFSKDNFEG